MGNILFGANVRQVYDNSKRFTNPNNIIFSLTPSEFYKKVFTEVGKYNMRILSEDEKKRFPMQWSGEHPYSGSFQYIGYFGNLKAGF